MARTWLSVRVELVEGRGETFWPRPGRVFAAARSHTFAQLADAVDTAFARWDRSHLHLFTLGDGTLLGRLDHWDDPLDRMGDSASTKLSQLEPGAQFAYTFDMGDDWTHVCTVGPQRIDPLDELGIQPRAPLSYWGWGAIPDQYGRRWADDHGDEPLPPDPGYSDLPPLFPHWRDRPKRS